MCPERQASLQEGLEEEKEEDGGRERKKNVNPPPPPRKRPNSPPRYPLLLSNENGAVWSHSLFVQNVFALLQVEDRWVGLGNGIRHSAGTKARDDYESAAQATVEKQHTS